MLNGHNTKLNLAFHQTNYSVFDSRLLFSFTGLENESLISEWPSDCNHFIVAVHEKVNLNRVVLQTSTRKMNGLRNAQSNRISVRAIWMENEINPMLSIQFNRSLIINIDPIFASVLLVCAFFRLFSDGHNVWLSRYKRIYIPHREEFISYLLLLCLRLRIYAAVYWWVCISENGERTEKFLCSELYGLVRVVRNVWEGTVPCALHLLRLTNRKKHRKHGWDTPFESDKISVFFRRTDLTQRHGKKGSARCWARKSEGENKRLQTACKTRRTWQLLIFAGFAIKRLFSAFEFN